MKRRPLPPRTRDGHGLIVALLVGSGGLGGAERSTIELAAEDRARGGRFVVIARDRGHGAVSQLAEQLDVPLIRVSGLFGAIRAMRTLRPAVVWPFGLRWSLLVRLGVQRLTLQDVNGRRPVVRSAQRGLDTWRRPSHNFVDRATQGFVDRFVANSYAAGDMLVEKVGIDENRVVTIWSGVDEAWLGELPPRQAPPAARIIMVGTDRSEKGHPDALVALSQLAHRDDWVAAMYTSPSASLERRVRQLGLAHKVTVLSGHSLTPADYDNADILLHSSHAESLPRAVLEALARGLSVVATNVGDVSRLVGDLGRIVEPGDPQAIVTALTEAIEEVVAPDDATTRDARRARCPSQASVVRELRRLVGSLA